MMDAGIMDTEVCFLDTYDVVSIRYINEFKRDAQIMDTSSMVVCILDT